MQPKIKHLLAVLGLLLTLAACTAAPALPTATATQPGDLTPYPSATPSITPSPTSADTPTPLPSSTPTPITYTVKKGDDLYGIAIRFKVSLQDLLAANPAVTPNLMSVGTVLIIPASAAAAPTVPVADLVPTPVGLDLGTPNCLAEASGGVWCFLPVTNRENFAVENVTAVLSIVDASGVQLPAQTAYPLLNRLAPSGTLPLLAFLPAPVALPLQASAELASAVPVPESPVRYLTLSETLPQIQIAADGLSAAVSARLTLADPTVQASQVWLLAVAYDAAGRMLGVRRWENPSPLGASSSLEAALTVYSAGDAISRVEILTETRP